MQITSEMVEKGARGIAALRRLPLETDEQHEVFFKHMRHTYENDARAALRAALQQNAQEPK